MNGSRSFALALGLGAARGLAHIAVLEAIDELGVRPAAIAGTSIGALVGAAYASGLSGRDLRGHAARLLHDRNEVYRRLLAARVGRLTDLFATGNPVLLDAIRFVDQFLPPGLPGSFEELQIPFTAVATDFWRRAEAALHAGALRPAIAASMAIPGLLRPVEIDQRLLVDGGAVNPLPFDLLRGKADIVVAVDVTGGSERTGRGMPVPLEAIVGTFSVMAHTIVEEKLKSGRPDLLLQPNVGAFSPLDFFRITPILRAAEPIKEEVKRKLGALLESASVTDALRRTP